MSPQAEEYGRLSTRLDLLIEQGKDECLEAELIRDQTDPLWLAMTEEEREGFRQEK